MSKRTTCWVAFDVHAEKIAVAVCGEEGVARSLGIIDSDSDSVARLIRRLKKEGNVRVCYEAGPCGYVLYWQLVGLGVHCDVIAPALIPRKPGDRVKTDRRDALHLARCYRNGDLTRVWVPDRGHEALRELVRLRAVAKKDEHRARRRCSQMLLRHGFRKPNGMTAWRDRHRAWIKAVHLEQPAERIVLSDLLVEVEHQTERVKRIDRFIDEAIAASPPETRALIEALQALRGVARVVAATLVAEIGRFSRFTRPAQLMSYSGAVPSEHSSGRSIRRGGITKAGNAHVRRVLVEAAWSYRTPPRIYLKLRERQKNVDERTREISWKAQQRLYKRLTRLTAIGKPKPKALTAVARELLGFIWAIAIHVEKEFETKTSARKAA